MFESCPITERYESKVAFISKGVEISMATIISTPISRITLMGKLLDTPPSTKVLPSITIGSNPPGIAIDA